MCGIPGIVGGGPPLKSVLVRMAEVMAHSVPDGQGTGVTTTPAWPSAAWPSSASTAAPTSRCTWGPVTWSSTVRATTIASCARSSNRGAPEADVAAGRWHDVRAAWRAFNLELWLRGVERPAPRPVGAVV